jgi:hypothetical protein
LPENGAAIVDGALTEDGVGVSDREHLLLSDQPSAGHNVADQPSVVRERRSRYRWGDEK